MSNTVATVSYLQGQAWAKSPDGSVRPLHLGDWLYEGEVVVTAEGARVELQFTNGDQLDVDGGQEVAMSRDLSLETVTSIDEAMLDDASVDKALSVLEQKAMTLLDDGEDLLEELEETAAGESSGGGSGNEGHNFIQLARVIESTDPQAFQYGAANRGEFVDPSTESEIFANNNDDESNTSPVVGDQDFSVAEDQVLNGQISATDLEGDSLSYNLTTDPANGVLTLDPATGEFVYTPNENFHGVDNFTVSITDTAGNTLSHTIALNVTSVNDAPTTGNITLNTAEEASVQGQISATDLDDDSPGFSIATAPANGNVSIDAVSGLFTYTPNANFSGTDSFVVNVFDGQGGITTSVVTINVGAANDAPVINTSALSTNEDLPLAGQINAVDPDGDTLAYGLVSQPTHGTLSLNPETGAFVYTPNTNYHGSDSFIVRVTDSQGTSVTRTINLTVTAVNDAPVASSQNIATTEDASVSGTIAASDVDSSSLSYFVTTTAANGSVVLDPVTGAFTYTPNANFSGNDSFVVTISDGNGGTTTSTINVTVDPINDAPTSADQNLTTNEDVALTGNVVASDLDGDTLSYAVSTNATNGTVSLDPVTGAFTYTPNANFHGSDSFVVTISDGNGGTATSTVNVTVDPVNDTPTSADQNLTTNEDVALTGSISATDLDGDTLSYVVSTSATNGTVSLDPVTGAFTYSPAANFHGSDSFVVTISDGNGGTTTSTINVTVDPVNDAPTSADQNLTTNEDTVLTGSISASDLDGDTLSYAVSTGAANGTVSLDPVTGAFTYTPNANFHGSDSFIVTISDGNGGTTTSTINVTVDPVNDTPTSADQNLTTNEDVALTGSITASDLDGDTLAYSVSTNAANGSVTLDPLSGAFTYTPNANFHGSDSFVVTISDGNGGTTTSTINVTVDPVNDTPTSADQNLTTNEDVAVTGSITATDLDGDTLAYSVLTNAANGSVTLDPATGAFTYTPNANFHGNDSFVVTISDGNGGTTTSTINVTVDPVNDAPISADQNLTTNEDIALTGNISAADLDGDTLAYSVSTNAANGSVTLDPVTGAFTYTPNANFHGSDSFVVTISDGNGGTTTSTVNVTVDPVNDVPTSADQNLTTNEDTALTGNISASDLDGDALSYAVSSNAANGSVVLDPVTGAFTYTPNADFHGSDSFVVTISDGNGGTTTSTINVTVDPVNDTPTSADQNLTTNEDVALTGSITASDLDGDALSYTVSTGAANGTVALDPVTGAFTYTPNSNFHGGDSFVVTISDGNGGTTTSTINVTVDPVNDAPTSADQNLTTNEDTALTGNVVASDLDGDTPAYSVSTNAANGSVTLDPVTGAFTYTPNANFHGSDSFVVTISDGNGGTTTSTINVTVDPVNDAPTSADQNLTTNEDAALTGNISATDLDGDTLAYSVSTNATNGSVVLDPATGAFTYTPNANFHGSDSFVVTISDGNGGTTTSTINVTVDPVNDTPTSADQNLTTNEDTALTGNISATDLDGDTLAYSVSTNAANGSVTLDPATGAFTYTPNSNFHGGDSFVVTISDGNGGTTTSTINLTVDPVNDTPTSADQNLTTNEDTALTGNISATDLDGDTLAYSVSTNAANGSVTLDPATGAFTYTPNANFHGSDSFVVTISDGNGGTTTSTINVTVDPINDAPTSADQNLTTNEDVALTGNVVASDLDGDTLAYSVSTNAANGSVSLDPVTGAFTYTPAANFHGSDSFVVTISDGNGGTATSTINVTVDPVNDAPTSANQSLTTNEDTALTGNISATDLDGDTLAYSVSTNAANGSVTLDPVTGAFTYTPNANFSGNDSFVVTISDGNGGTTTSTINVTVDPINDAPTSADQNLTTNEDVALTGSISATDLDGDTLSYVVSTSATNGTVSLDPVTGAFIYSPAANFHGSDSFVVTISDGNGGTTTSTINVTVDPVNDAPTSTDQSLTTNEDTALTGNISAADLDGDTLAYSVSTNAANGSVALDSLSGAFTYTPNANFHGSDSFVVTISDGNGGTTTSTINVTVDPVNDAPTSADQSLTTNEDIALTGSISASDLDGDTLAYSVSTNAVNGSVSLDPVTGAFTYTPNANFHGSDSFVVTISDGNGGTTTSTINVTVDPVNDAPTSTDQNITTSEDTALTGSITANDLDGDTLAYSVSTNAVNGSVSLDPVTGAFTYTPNSNFHGSDSFVVTISDGNGGTTTSTINVTVDPVNDTPTSANQNLTTNEDTAINGTVSAADVDGDTLAYSISTNAVNGSVVLDPVTGAFTYTPNANFHGSDSFVVTTSDGNGGTTTSTINVTVDPVNDAPTSADQSLTTNEDAALAGNISASDLDGDTLSYAVSSNAANGSIALDPVTGAFTYTPNANFHGSDSFIVTISDGNGGTTTSTINVTVDPVNDVPTSADQNLTTSEDVALTGSITANDLDGDTLAYAVSTNAANGSVTLDPVTGTFTYTPNANFHGSDSFVVTISDGNGGTTTSAINVTIDPVNDAPTSADQNLTTNEGTALTGSISASDLDGDALSYAVSSNAANGSVVLDPVTGAFTYTPNANFHGSDSFVVTISDGNGGTTTSTINVTVDPVNDAPTSADQNLTTNEDVVLTGSITANDLDGDTLAYSVSTNAANGSVTLDSVTGAFTYTPNANFHGSDLFVVTISDGNGGTTTSTINLTVDPVNDAPTSADQNLTTNEDVALTGNVVASDLDGDTLAYSVLTNAANGSVTLDPVTGAFTYTPNANFHGSDSFVVTISDGNGGTTTSTINLTVDPVNDAPTSADQNLTTNEDVALAGNVVASDLDGDTLAYSVLTNAANGSVTLDPVTGAFTYTPNANFHGSDSFVVTISDGNGGTTTSTINVTVDPVNDAPTSADQNLTTNEDTALTGNVVASDLDGDTLAYSVSTNAANGSVTLDPVTGAFTYTPAANFHGSDSFVVTISDGNGGTTTSTINVTVDPVNDVPTSADQNIVTNEDTAINGSVSATDLDSDTLAYSVSTNAANGSVVLDPVTGAFTYTPNADFHGSDSFIVTISDGNGGTTTSTINVTVDPVNDVPTSADQNIVTNEDVALTGSISASDLDGDTLSYAVSTNATNGTVSLDPVTGAFTYTPNANFHGSDSFVVTISDGNGGTTTSTINVTVDPVNDAPTSADQNLATNEDTVISGTISATDLDGDTLSYAVSSNAANGSVVLDPATGAFTYTPAANFHGSDSFVVTISDGNGGTATSTINVTVDSVNDVPTSADQNLTTNEDTALTGSITSNDLDGDTLAYSVSTNAMNGAVTLDPVTGAFTYTPAASFHGSDSFVVTVSDGNGGTTTSTINVTVDPVNDAPTSADQSLTTNEDIALTGSISASDLDGDILAYSVSTSAANGSVTLDPVTGAFTYTPNANFHGSDSFVVTISDGNGGTTTSTINVTVDPVNDVPTSADQNLTTNEDAALTGNISAADLDGDILAYSVSTSAANGSVTLDPVTGAFTYTPNANFHGSDSFVVTISDGNGGTTTSTINVTVDPVNDAPTSADQNLTTNEDTALTGNISAADLDGDTLNYAVSTNATNGTVSLDPVTGAFTYSPAANFHGSDSFVVTISDGNGGTTTSTINLTVDPANDAPTSTDQNLTTNEDTVLTGSISASDLDGDTLSYAVSTGAANGLVSLDPVTGAFTYTPNANFHGSDSFIVTISDGNGGTTTSTINVGVSSVNDPSVITPATANLTETNSVLTTSGTLAITDVDGPAPAFVPQTNVLGAAGYGRFTLQADGDWAYTTTSAQNQFVAGVTYTDSLTVTASDGSTSTITVNIVGTNDAPSLTSMLTSRSYAESTGSGVTRTILDSSVTLTDVDSANFDGGSVTVTINNVVAAQDQLTVQNQGTGVNQISVVGTDVRFNFGSGAVSIGTISGGTGGAPLTISLNSNATPASVDALVQRIAYGNTSQLPDTTPRSLTLTIVDGDGTANGGTDTRTHNLTVNVTSSNDAPTLDALSGTRTHVEGGAAVVLDNNATLNDPELALTGNFGGMKLTVGRRGGINADDDFVGSGSLSLSGGNVILAGVTVGTYDTAAHANGQLVITFANGTSNAQATSVLRQIAYSHGSDNPPSSAIIDFVVNDGNSGAQGTGGSRNSPTRSVRVNITPTTDPAVLGADSGDVKEDTPAQASASGVLSIIDYDPGQAAFQTQTNTAGTYGFFSIDSVGNWIYNIDDSNPLVQALKEGETKTEVFVVRSIDGTQTTVTVTVTGTNDGPIAGNQSLSTTEDTALNGTISVTDIDGDNLSYVVSTPAANGSVTIDPVTGEFIYTPDANFHGADSFVVTISDGNGGTTTSTITVNVTPVNDAPVANDDSFTTNEDTPILFNLADLRANDTDVDGDPITVISAFSAVNGTLSIIGGQLAFTPSANYSGPASFSYMITDGNGATDTATVNITVNTVDDPSVLGADTTSAAEDSVATGNVLSNDSDVESTLSVVSFGIAGVTGSFTAGQIATITNVGTFTLDSNGDYTFTPDANWNGSVPQITYTTNTGSSSTLDITVTPVNDAPVAADDSFTTNEDTPILFDLADLRANDTDIDGDPITVISAFSAVNGTLSIIGGQLAFTPNANYNGPASFSYMITDGNGATDTATVNITVNPVDDASLLVADTQTIAEDTIATGNLLGNDADIDNTLSIASFQIAGNATVFNAGQIAVITNVGTFTVESDGDYTFTPDANWNGSVPQVTYTTNTGSTSTLDINVTSVNDAPVAQAANFTVAEDAAIVNGSVVATDADAGAVLSYALDAAAPAGLTFNADGTYSFDASNAAYQSLGVGQSVVLTIPYTVTDDQGATSSANLEITVNGTNDAAVITPVAVNLTETNMVLTTSGTVSISDVDSPATFIAQTNAAGSNGYGTFTIDTNGVWTYTTNTANNEFVAGTTYSDSITVTSADGTTSTITVNILGTNDAPVAIASTTSGNEDAAFITLSLSGSDVDGSIASLKVTTLPTAAQGVLYLADGVTAVTTAMNLTPAQAAALKFVPTANYNGTVTIPFTVTDNSGSTSTSANATITVNAVNDAPDAVNDQAAGTAATNTGLISEYYGYREGTHGGNLTSLSQIHDFINSRTPDATFTATTFDYGSTNPFSNDLGRGTNLQTFLGSDAASLSVDPGDSSDAIIRMRGFVELSAGNYNFKILADDGYQIRVDGIVVAEVNKIQSPTGTVHAQFAVATSGMHSIEIIYWDQGGQAVFKVELSDDAGTTYDLMSSIPASKTTVFSVVEDTSFSIPIASVLTNDTDLDGDSLTVSSVQGAVNGTVQIVGSSIVFTPSANYSGPASFTYTVSDGKGGTDTATVSLSVAPVNDAPVAVSNTAGVATNSSVVITTASLLANDTDVDGDTLSFVSAQNAVNGTVSVSGTNITFTPTAGFEGAGSFTYTIRDQQGATSTATVNVAIGSATAPALVVPKSIIALAQGTGGTSVAFPIISALVDTDGSETLSARISNVPTSFTFNAGTNLGGGVWSFSAADLPNLTMNVPGSYTTPGFTGTDLTVSAITTESNGQTATTSTTVRFSADYTTTTLTAATPGGSVTGTTGDDYITGGSGDNSLSAGAGNDLVYGNDGADTITGADGYDVLYGGAGNDVITAGNGRDRIVGGAGNDTLLGGANSTADTTVDVFAWSLGDQGAAGAPAVDTIQGFGTGAAASGDGGDVLDLRDLLSGDVVGASNGAGNLANFLHFEISGGNTIIHISHTGGFSADSHSVGGSYTSSAETQQIVLTGVNLQTLYSGATTDAAIITNLLNNNKLITD